MQATKTIRAMTMTAMSAVMLTACGVDADLAKPAATNASAFTSGPESESAESALFNPGDFELYNKPFHEPNSACEVVTEILLVNGFAGPMTALSEEAYGPCEINVPRRGRAFDLKVEAASCGSKRYYGTANSDGSDGLPVSIEIIDNRERVCNDRVAPLVVKETYADGQVKMRYAPVTE